MPDNKKKSKFSLRKLIYNDKYLIIISIIVAVIIWIASSMNLSPETTKRITVPVQIDFSNSVANDLGLKCYGADTINVDVTVNVKRYLAKDISADDVNVELQTNSVTTTGTHEIPISVTSNDTSTCTVSSYFPMSYSAYFDVAQEQEMEVDLKYSNNDYVADGYVSGDAIISEPSVIVSGPKSYMSRVSKVMASVDIKDKLNKATTVDVTPKAVDVYGNEVDYCDIKLESEKMSVTLPILKKVSLPVSATLTDIPKGINDSGINVKYSQETLSAGVLEDAKITTANIGDISYTSLDIGENKFDFDVTGLDGITVLDDTEKVTVTVTVPTTYKDKKIAITSDNIDITGLPDNYSASIAQIDFSSVTVIGNSSVISGIKAENIKMSCDLTPKTGKDIKTGNIKTAVKVSLNTANGSWAYGKYNAVIYVTKK